MSRPIFIFKDTNGARRAFDDELADILEFINVPVQLTYPMTGVRGDAGLLALPDRAHTNHRYDRDVLRILVGDAQIDAAEREAENE